MSQRGLLLLTVLLLVAHSAFSQPNWREVVMPGFNILSTEINDSIASRRAEAEKLRAEMLKISTSKNLNPVLIFGPGNKYLVEGMHKEFVSPPGPMQGNFERDKQIVLLENLHVQLYYSDKALFRWLDLQSRLRNHPDMAMHGRWALQYKALPEKERPDPQSNKACQKWVADQLACDLATALQGSNPDKTDGKVKAFDPKFLPRPWDTIPSLGADWKLPFPAEGIIASLPMNGQFAFHVSQSIPGVGYIVFPKGTNRQIHELIFGNNYQLKARWTSAKGEVKYTAAEYRHFDSQFFYNLPDKLLPEMIYRLELVALPPGFKPAAPDAGTCWQIFRGKPAPEKKETNVAVAGEVKITELYFRGGKYDPYMKMEMLRGTLNWELGTLDFETDEPFDGIELYGNGQLVAPVWFDVQTVSFQNYKELNDQTVFYYLTVPKVEPLENLPLDQLAVAERDNTLDAPFVRKVALGNPEIYPNVPADREHDIRLPGKYVAPAFKNHGAKDTLNAAKPVPFITKDLFLKEKTLAFPRTKCSLHIGELKQTFALAAAQKNQLRRRVDERVKFFFELEKRRAARRGEPFNLTLEQVRQQEMENLPTEVKKVLEASYPDDFQKNFTLIYCHRFPGTEQYLALLELKLDEKK
jgi:hypothetical protein